MSSRLIGIAVFVLAGIAVLVSQILPNLFGDPLANLRPKEQIQAWGFIGGEKRGFMNNPEVQRALKNSHGLTIDARKAGSIEMVSEASLINQRPDFFWPSSQVAAALGKENGIVPKSDDIIFNSPIVLFSWTPIAEALVRKGLASDLTGQGLAYSVDAAKLLALIAAEGSWAELGVDALFGRATLSTTDPNHSNSGNQFAGLAYVMLESQVGSEQAQSAVAQLYKRMGYMERSSSDLFDQYIRTGMGAKPLIAGYENQLIEFSLANPEIWNSLKGQALRPVVLYPEPTVYSSHVLMAMNDKGKALREALRQPDIQQLAWQQHGFRSGFAYAGAEADQPLPGLPVSVTKIVPMPGVARMQSLLQEIARATGANH